jgi:hypothetical protein
MVDDYPRTTLSFGCSRRHFFKALLRETVVVIKTARGGHSFRLSELGSLPDDQLAQIIPAMNLAYEIYVAEDHLWTRHKQTGKTFKEFLLNEENRRTFNLFNGRNTLGEIAWQLSQDLGWEEARSFAHARDLFLSLVDHLACQPGNPIEQDGD